MTPYLVGVLGARLAVHPSQQRLEPGDILWIDQEVDEQGDAAERLEPVTIDRVSMDLSLPLERDDGVADVGRLDVAPIQICRVPSHRKVELGRDPLPQRGELRIEPTDWLALGA